MAFLVILKRVEIWVLVILVTALVVVALRPEPEPGFSQDLASNSPPSVNVDTAPVTEEKGEAITVRDISVADTEGGQIVSLTLVGRSPGDDDLILDESNLSAMTLAGEPVNRFFEPFREPARLSASGDSSASLRWWMESDSEALLLDVGGEKIRVELP